MDELLFKILILLLIVKAFYYFAKEFYHIAELKGFTNKKYLWISFFVPWIGYLLVIALPDRKQQNEQKNLYDNNELPTL